MEQNKYISIADFAERAGVTSQAIYKRQSKDLKPFLKLVGNKKVISEAALQLFASTDSTSTVEQPVDNHISAEDKLNSTLERELEHTNHQLELTNRQLELTTEMLRSEQDKNTTLQEQILKLSNEFCEITKQSNVLASQAQQLQALQAPKPEPEPQPQPGPVPEKKSPWWKRKK